MSSSRHLAESVFAGVLLFSCTAAPAHGHGLDTALLELREVGSERVALRLIDAGALDRRGTRITARLSPESSPRSSSRSSSLAAPCRDLTPATERQLPSGLESRRWLSCPGGLRGRAISADWQRGGGELLVRAQFADGGSQQGLLRPDGPALALQAQSARGARGDESLASIIWQYTGLGLRHIAGGADHLLFVLGLLLLCRNRRTLITAVSAFTLGHSITLTIAVLCAITGAAALPPAPVEAAIALSIVLLAIELARDARGAATGGPPTPPRPGWRGPPTMALGFGLLHGLGFAGALTDIGLPTADVPPALFAFNAGVELGQLLFVAAVLLLARAARGWAAPVWGKTALIRAIGGVASFWLIERVLTFWQGA